MAGANFRAGLNRLYMDNAATSFPKPKEVLEAIVRYANEIGASAGRGAYAEARESGQVIRTCRERLNTLFNGENPDHFVFTMNCSDALNLGIRGMLRAGDHAITTWMDHNSVLRPLNAMVSEGLITQTRVAVDPVTCVADPLEIKRAITAKTKLIAVVHGSNVTGTVQRIGEIGRIAREAGVVFLVDGAQTAGHVPLDVQRDCIDLLAFPGHKGLLGPLGTGALYVKPGLEKELRPLRYGGTGSVSEQDVQPGFMPDKFESGSHNALGIAGLSEGVAWILKRGVASLYEHDRGLCKAFIEGVEGVEGLRYFGPQGVKDRMGVFSVRIGGMEPGVLAGRLEAEYGILTRAGLHCAPLAHRTIGTVFDLFLHEDELKNAKTGLKEGGKEHFSAEMSGTTRLSFGPFLTVQDVRYAADALAKIAIEDYVRAG